MAFERTADKRERAASDAWAAVAAVPRLYAGDDGGPQLRVFPFFILIAGFIVTSPPRLLVITLRTSCGRGPLSPRARATAS